jgi:PBP1b-binding outer membrane lipoprotein LpoB
MKYIIYLSLVSMLITGCSKCETARFNTKEDLIDHYITAVNNKNLVSLKKSYHPQLLKRITNNNADFFNDLFTKELSRNIPPDRNISYHEMSVNNNAGFSNLFFNNSFDYPIKPTLSCEINYKKTEYSFVSMYLYLSNTKDCWFLVLPIPKQETIIKYRQAKKDKEKQTAEIAKIIETMDSQIYSKIVEQLKQKSLMRAIEVFKNTYGDETTQAVLVVEEIRRRENLEW